jgi:hypothetical protein
MHKNMYKDFVERQNIEQYPSTEKKNTAYILAPLLKVNLTSAWEKRYKKKCSKINNYLAKEPGSRQNKIHISTYNWPPCKSKDISLPRLKMYIKIKPPQLFIPPSTGPYTSHLIWSLFNLHTNFASKKRK